MNDATNSHENLQAEIHDLAVAIKAALIERGEMMATAESCTGGLVASSIVNEAGSIWVRPKGIQTDILLHDVVGFGTKMVPPAEKE